MARPESDYVGIETGVVVKNFVEIYKPESDYVGIETSLDGSTTTFALMPESDYVGIETASPQFPAERQGAARIRLCWD